MSIPTISGRMYFEQMRPHFPEDELEAIKTAYDFSKYGHRGQKRKGGGRYFDHPKAVSWILFDELKVRDRRAIIAALLHDIREDSFILTEYRIKRNFGKKVAWDVRLLTKDDKSIYYDRLHACMRWRAVLVKICDRIHNMRTLDECPPEHIRKQVVETREYFFGLCTVLKHIIPSRYQGVVDVCERELASLCARYDTMNPLAINNVA